MYTLNWICVLLISIAGCLEAAKKGSNNGNSGGASTVQRVSRAHLEFALSLYQRLASDLGPRENLVISPHSIASVLSQLWLGSGVGSSTYRQLEKVLFYRDSGLTPSQAHQTFHPSNYGITDNDLNAVVDIANGIFLQKGVSLRKEFEEDLAHFYNSSVNTVDFTTVPGSGTRSAQRVVNKWVSTQTKGRISSLIDKPLSQETRMVIVNALVLDAHWLHSFDPTMTAANGIFHLNSKSKLEIPMMAGKFQVSLGESNELGCRLLELPFRARRLSMFLLLPNEETGDDPTQSLRRLESSLNSDTLKQLFSTLTQETVHVRMPRFRVSLSTALEDTLRRMGLVTLFDPQRANLSRMSTNTQLAVSAMAHKVQLEVTEKGTEGAAATSSGIERFGEIGEFFEVNRPFIFLIWDYKRGALLFIGRVTYPEPLFNSS
ncbi:unnamed protein product [Orchesella dallaii]|uniref:Serpin domain-containing protein n=1 Tax=Orchesella dallaii TaxID=48710 RepID=A0ABP1QJJ7_9HEXA